MRFQLLTTYLLASATSIAASPLPERDQIIGIPELPVPPQPVVTGVPTSFNVPIPILDVPSVHDLQPRDTTEIETEPASELKIEPESMFNLLSSVNPDLAEALDYLKSSNLVEKRMAGEGVAVKTAQALASAYGSFVKGAVAIIILMLRKEGKTELANKLALALQKASS